MLLRPEVPRAATPLQRADRDGSAARAALDFARGPLLRWRLVIDFLSEREQDDLERAAASGEGWARVIRACFAEGARLLLGTDHTRSDAEIAAAALLDPAAVVRAVEEAERWCTARGLHLLGYPAEDPAGEWRHFLAVG